MAFACSYFVGFSYPLLTNGSGVLKISTIYILLSMSPFYLLIFAWFTSVRWCWMHTASLQYLQVLQIRQFSNIPLGFQFHQHSQWSKRTMSPSAIALRQRNVEQWLHSLVPIKNSQKGHAISLLNYASSEEKLTQVELSLLTSLKLL